MANLRQRMANYFTPKNAGFFFCKNCDFKCCKHSDWERHILTHKHRRLTKTNSGDAKNAEILDTNKFVCYCGKNYKHASSLSKHKKICKDVQLKDDDIEQDIPITKELVIKLLQENQKLQQTIIESLTEQNSKLLDNNSKIIELAKEGKSITNNTTNNQFNLNLFLNEKCKDAINLVDFVDSLELTLTDLEETGRLGYAEGISRIFVNGLNGLDVHKRPIHCSDVKREVLYIKNKNMWFKEDDEKSILCTAIKIIGNKNIKQIREWQKENPYYNDPESKQNDKYNKLIFNTMSGSTIEEQRNNLKKVIRNVSKEVAIHKDSNIIN